jgi:isopentenyldiphosphate isomerase
MEKEVRFFLNRSQELLIHSLTARKQTFSNNVKVILSSHPHWPNYLEQSAITDRKFSSALLQPTISIQS